jgi:membrane protease YdiL (CAAX protease family)
MKTSEPHKRSPLKFFILTFSLATPFWVLNSLVKVEGLPLEIPVTDLALAFMPLTASVILVYREEGPGDAKKLLKRIFDYKRIQQKIWYLPIVLLMPFLYVLIYWSMRLIGLTLPAEPHIPLLTMALLFVLFFVLAEGEEIGWMGYAADPLQDRWSALTAGFILGLVSAIGHYPSMLEQGRDLTWMAWGTLGTLAGGYWLYGSTATQAGACLRPSFSTPLPILVGLFFLQILLTIRWSTIHVFIIQ